MNCTLRFSLAVATLLVSLPMGRAIAEPVAPLRLPMTTPEGHVVESAGEPIVSFIDALNRKDFKNAATYVSEVEPRTNFEEIERILKTIDAKYTLTSYEAKSFGKVMLVNLQVAVKGLPAGDFNSQETLVLRREDATWKIVPADRYRIDAARPDKILLQMATMLARPNFHLFDSFRTEFTAARNQMLQLTAALSGLMKERQQTFALTAETFEESLLPFLSSHSEEAFVDPYLGKGKISYSFNANLSGLPLEKILDTFPDPKEVVAIYEGKDGKLDFRHDGNAFVATVNTLGEFAVKHYTAETAKSLNWQP